MKVKTVIITAVMFLVIPALSLAAPPHPGGYFSGFIGVSVPRDSAATGDDFTGPVPVSFDETINFDPGINVGGALGYDFGMVRLEGEMSYKQGEMANITDNVSGVRLRNADGTLGAFTMMLNGFIDLHNSSPVTPYAGGGFGFANLYLSDTTAIDPTTGERVFLYQGDEDIVFAYQAGGGVEIALNRRYSIDVGYRYLATSRGRFGANLDITTDAKFESHNAAVAFRVRF